MLSIRGPLVVCKGCGARFHERRRRPCRTCGSINRVISREASETLGAADKAG